MCKVLGVSKSGYFKWLNRPKSDRQKKHEKLSQTVLQTHLEFKQRYGSTKITKTLNKRGVQYASIDYQKLLKQYDMISSMSRKGNCYDNACIEFFPGILKRELVYQIKYKTRDEARKSLFEYIEFFYNSKRIHSTLDYHTPNEFEKLYEQKSAA